MLYLMSVLFPLSVVADEDLQATLASLLASERALFACQICEHVAPSTGKLRECYRNLCLRNLLLAKNNIKYPFNVFIRQK